MGSNRNHETQSQAGQQTTSEHDQDGQTARGPGEGQRSNGQQQVELPEHQGVMTDYVPPSGGMRSEVGDLDSDDDQNAGNATGAADEPLPGHLGGGLAGG